jgi:hypothetical protein
MNSLASNVHCRFRSPHQRDRCGGSSTVRNFLWISVTNEAEVISRDRNVNAYESVSLLYRNEHVAHVQAQGSDVAMRGSDVLMSW